MKSIGVFVLIILFAAFLATIIFYLIISDDYKKKIKRQKRLWEGFIKEAHNFVYQYSGDDYDLFSLVDRFGNERYDAYIRRGTDVSIHSNIDCILVSPNHKKESNEMLKRLLKQKGDKYISLEEYAVTKYKAEKYGNNN